MLRVFFITEGRYAGDIEGPTSWPADVVPEPVVVVRRRPMMIPLELVLLVLGLVGGVVWVIRRRRRR